jgi:cytochrome c2
VDLSRDSPYRESDRRTLAVIGVVLLVAMIVAGWKDRHRDYPHYQKTFRAMVAKRLGPDRALAVPSGLQQIWVPGMRRADRCVTCHQAVAWPGFETAAEPYRTHPAEPLSAHSPERFGCSACHGGQGWAVGLPSAHGDVAGWEEPLLGSRLGAAYSLAGGSAALVQMNCNRCHRYEQETKGADVINLAKRLVRAKGCRACHVINRRGGVIGPDLTLVGEKSPEQFDYRHLPGRTTAFAWHIAHLTDPRGLVPDTMMPNFHLSTVEAQAMAILVLSWRRAPSDAAFLPGALRRDAQTTAERQVEDEARTGPGGWFGQTGCYQCHPVASLKVKSLAQIGPDLSPAVEDTRKRFGLTVDQFLANPTGMMSAVLSRQIILTGGQRAIAATKLREAFSEYQHQIAEGRDPLAAPGLAPPK